MSAVEVRVPDLGDAKGVAVLDVLVKKGDKVAVEDPLITLESDKAAMDVPSPVAGVINSIATVESDAAAAPAQAAAPASDKPPKTAAPTPTAAPAPTPVKSAKTASSAVSAAPAGAVDVVVLGAGVGG